MKNDVKTLAKEVAEANKYTGYNIKVTKVTVKVRKDDKGSEITHVIAEGLISKKEYKVTEVGYKFNPLTFIISTSVKSSDPKAKELGVKIEKTIQDFLRLEGMKAILKNEPYKINVISKDKRKLN
ncbi:DUF4030 domain-containing protein [Terrilactibacillus laevilacticus]|uniref:DUF4030 domain-containing protein n=1 Tax=Terrilactibacillus laevilacticus TaxID=1380157 RepID=UPI00248233D0|nr:DUF4030 domain-containing protein [Terrilactibacillus laevilacticus]